MKLGENGLPLPVDDVLLVNIGSGKCYHKPVYRRGKATGLQRLESRCGMCNSAWAIWPRSKVESRFRPCRRCYHANG